MLVVRVALRLRRRICGRGRRLGDDHAGLLLVLVVDGAGGGAQAGLDLVVLLDDGAAVAPKRRAAVAEAGPRDAEALADLGPLQHRVHPVEAREEAQPAVDQAVAVQVLGRLHGRVAEAL